MLVKIKETAQYMKDMESGAIVSIDRKINNEYKNKKALINKDKTRDKEMEEIKERLSEINTLKSDLSEIKLLLKELTGK